MNVQLENEMKVQKERMLVLLDKSKQDDQLIDGLQAELERIQGEAKKYQQLYAQSNSNNNNGDKASTLKRALLPANSANSSSSSSALTNSNNTSNNIGSARRSKADIEREAAIRRALEEKIITQETELQRMKKELKKANSIRLDYLQRTLDENELIELKNELIVQVAEKEKRTMLCQVLQERLTQAEGKVLELSKYNNQEAHGT